MLSKSAPLPEIVFKDAISAETMAYLGIPLRKNFSINNMQGSLFVVEIFNTYCVSCPRNVPMLNGVFKAVEKKGAAIKGDTKVFGIAIGNTKTEAESYKTQHNVLYPVLTDYDFAVHNMLGNPRVPYTICIRKTPKGNIIVHSHQGVLESAESILKKCVG